MLQLKMQPKLVGERVSTLIVALALVFSSLATSVSPFLTKFASAVEATNVVINEVKPSSIGGVERWIELYNPTASAVDLTGWRVNRSGSVFVGATALNGVMIPAGGYYVLESTDSTLVQGGGTLELWTGPASTGELVDTFTYSDVAAGQSYGRVTDGANEFIVFPVPTKSSANLLFNELISTDAYVSPNGDDNNAGTEVYPYRTIQKAVSESKTGGTIRVSAGDYVINSPININKSLTITAATGVTVTQAATNQYIFALGGDATDVTIEGFTLLGGGVTANAGASNITIQNNSFLNSTTNPGASIRHTTSGAWPRSSNWKVLNNTISPGVSGQNSGIVIPNTDGVMVSGNVITNTGYAAINISGSSNVTVSGNSVENIPFHGVNLSSNSGLQTVINNTFTNVANNPSDTAAVRITRASASDTEIIEGNSFSDVGEPIYYKGTNKSVYIASSPLAVTNTTVPSETSLYWSKVEGATGYKLRYRVSGTSEWLEAGSYGSNSISLRHLITNPDGTPLYTDDQFMNLYDDIVNGVYEWQVAAFNGAHSGVPSDSYLITEWSDSNIAIATVNFDTTSPTAPILENPVAYLNNENNNNGVEPRAEVRWTHDGVDVDHFEYHNYYDDKAAAEADTSGNTGAIYSRGSNERSHDIEWSGYSTTYYRIVAVDTAGNRTASEVGTIIIDNTKPRASFQLQPPSVISSSFHVRLRVDGEAGLIDKYVYFDSEDASNLCYSKNSDHRNLDVKNTSCPEKLASLAEGAHKFVGVAFDRAGNKTIVESKSFIIDRTGPAITIKSDSVGSENIFSTVSFKLYDANKVDKVVINGVEKNLTDNNWSDINYVKPGVFGAKEGLNTLVVYDVAGNTTTYEFTIDTAAPDVELISPSNNTATKGTKVTQSWSTNASDVDHFVYESWNNEDMTSLRWREKFTTTSKTASKVADATYYWRVKAVDKAGNESDWTPLWKLTVDNTAPVPYSIRMYVGDIETHLVKPGDIVRVVVEAEDVLSGIDEITILVQDSDSGARHLLKTTAMQYNGNNSYIYEFAVPTEYVHLNDASLTDRTLNESQNGNEYIIKLTDKAGNVRWYNGEIDHKFTIDKTAPSPILSVPAAVGNNALVGVAATTDGAASYRLFIDNELKDSGSTPFGGYSWDTADLASRSYNIRIETIDLAGNVGFDEKEITVDNDGPLATISTSGIQNTATPLIEGTVGADTTELEIYVDGVLQSSGLSFTAGESRWSFARIFTSGTYTVKVIARDSFGNESVQTVGLEVYVPEIESTNLLTSGIDQPQAQLQAQTVVTDLTPGEVLGASTTENQSEPEDGDGEINGAATVAAVADGKWDGALLGLKWYWWLLILVGIGAVLWIILAIRRRKDDQE